jgi:preprotein translocase subunit YajC
MWRQGFHAGVKALIIVPFRTQTRAGFFMVEQLLNIIVTPAYADVASVVSGSQQSGTSFVVMFGIFFIFIYFAIWRPQNKRLREQQSMLTSLAKGDEVVTVGGVIGRITKVGEQFLTLSVTNNVELFLQKSSVASVLPKGTIKSIE